MEIFDEKTKHIFEALNGIPLRHKFSMAYNKNLDLGEDLKRNLINESMSINKDVEKIANDLYSRIVKHTKRSIDFYGYTPHEVADYEDKVIILEKEFNVITHFHIFSSQMEYFKTNFPMINTTDFVRRQIEFTFVIINGEWSSQKMRDIIYHELTHVYQMIKAGGFNESDKSKEIYAKATSIISQSGDPYNFSVDYIALASAIYGSFKYESDAFIHGLYGQLSDILGNVSQKKYGGLFYSEEKYLSQKVESIVNNSVISSLLKCMKATLNSYKEDTNNEIFEPYGMINANFIIKRIEVAYKYYLTKLGKMLTYFSEKYGIDLLKMNVIY